MAAYDAFISYRRKQSFAVAEMIRGLLSNKNKSAFVDVEELRNGVFDVKILNAIKESPSFIVVIGPGALDRCADEDDWLRIEVETAIDENKNIIPVLCDDFEWPKQWNENIPEKIRLLSRYNSVRMSYDYLPAMIDKIIEYMNSETHIEEDQTNIIANEPSTTEFFRRHMRQIDNLEGVDLAFHAGSVWHQDIDYIDILTEIAEAGIPIRIIINTKETALIVGQHMRHKGKKYMSFEDGIVAWQEFADGYENVELRLSQIPLLRICYSLKMKDSTENIARIKFYTYANPKINRNFIQDFTPADAYYELYIKEFDFLWNQSNKTE